MKISLRSFGLGVALTATTLGTVTYVNASTNSTIRACADRKTGDMRLITKGKCKKTERSLSWNQIGPQGPQGSKGDTGSRGIQGNAGSKLVVVDSSGKTLGPLLSATTESALLVLVGSHIWQLAASQYEASPSGIGGGAVLNADENCSTSLGRIRRGGKPSPQATYKSRRDTGHSPTGLYKWPNETSRSVYKLMGETCVLETESDQSMYDFVTLEQIAVPTYTPPLLVVEQ